MPVRVSVLAGHATHELLPARAPRLPYVFTGQATQSSATPVLAQPGRHDWHANEELLPVAGTAVPGEQLTHDDWPVAAL